MDFQINGHLVRFGLNRRRVGVKDRSIGRPKVAPSLAKLWAKAVMLITFSLTPDRFGASDLLEFSAQAVGDFGILS